MAPTVLREGQFRLFFFSREEARIHVHVAHPDGEAKFWLTPNVHLATSVGLNQKKLREAHSIVETHLEEIKMHGIAISAPEVTHISKHGFWLLWADAEVLLPFEKFPWFRQATIEQISHVEAPTPDHLYWPDLDIDLSAESIRNPDAFPLVSQARS